MIHVVISSADGHRELSEKLPLSSNALQLKTRWQAAHSVAIEDLLLETEDHKELEDNARLEEIVDRSAKVVLLIMSEATRLQFAFLSSDKQPVQLPIFLSTRPSALIPKIREHFAIEDSRAIRFSSRNGPLDSTISFQDQQVTGDCQISVEVELRVKLKSEWMCDEQNQPICCFTGDFVEPTLTSSLCGEFQLLNDDKLLNFSDRIGDVLGIAADQTVQVKMNTPRKVFVNDSSGTREFSVLPNTTIAELGLCCSNMLLCDAEAVSSSETLAMFANNALLEADLCITVTLSHEQLCKRRCRLVRLPARATVRDLWAKVTEFEKSREISLFFAGRRLSDFFAELRDLGVNSGSCVSSERDPPLTISMRHSRGQNLTFSAPEVRTVEKDAEAEKDAEDDKETEADKDAEDDKETEAEKGAEVDKDTEVKEGVATRDRSSVFLKGLHFKCTGCERKILQHMDGRQTVPVNCCDVASLQLIGAHHSADAGVQANRDAKQLRSIATDVQFDLEPPEFDLEPPEFDLEPPVRDQSVMAQPLPSHVWFHLCSADGEWNSWNIEIFPTDSPWNLLERLSKRANINVAELSYIYQFEWGILEGRDLRLFTECKKQILSEDGEEKWETVYANHDCVETLEDLWPKLLLITNTMVLEVDDVFCSPGLVPIISIDMRCVFFELDDSGGFVLIPENEEVLLDPQYVARIEAVRFVDEEGERPSVMLLRGEDQTWVDMKSGAPYYNLEDVMHAFRISRHNFRQERCYILLRSKSRLPKWPISPLIYISIAVRDRVDFSLNDGVIEVKESCPPSLSRRWIYPKCNLVEIPEDSKPHMLHTQIVQYITT